MKHIIVLLAVLISVLLWQPATAQTNFKPCVVSELDLADDADTLGGVADIDEDGDGLIEICYLEDLDAIRYQLNGSGYKASSTATKITAGCPPSGCKGYELIRDLDFLDDASYRNPTANKDDWTVSDYNDRSDRGWLPISGLPSDSVKFSGVFRGNGYAIRNLTINRGSDSRIALFGAIEGPAFIDSVRLLDVNIRDRTRYTGSLIGIQLGGRVNNSYASGDVRGTYYVGGLVASGSSGSYITNSSASVTVRGGSYIGGLIGRGATIADSSASGVVRGDDYVGGLVGTNRNSITNSYASGDVYGDDYVGGLAGHNRNSITNSHASGDVRGDSFVGGLVGSNLNTILSVPPSKIRATITNSHASGNVAGTYQVGGLVGLNGDFIINSSVKGNVAGTYQVGGLVGLNGGEITGSSASSDVEGTTNIGGLVGSNDLKASGFFFYTFYGILDGDSDGKITDSNADGFVSGYGGVGGLVGDNNGIIRGSYSNSDVIGKDLYAGGLAGLNKHSIINSYATGAVIARRSDFVGGLVGLNTKYIGNSSATNIITGYFAVGGLVGANDGGSITDSYTHGSIAGDASVGGLVGWNAKGEITGNYADVNVEGRSNVGGLIGFNQNHISNNRAIGNIEGDSSVGGLVGLNESNIADSHTTSSVVGKNDIGGLIGQNEGDVSSSSAVGNAEGNRRVGGLIGRNVGIITDCYADSNVSGKEDIGGLIGRNVGSAINGSYALGNVVGETNVGGLIGREERSTNSSGNNNQNKSAIKSYAGGDVVGETNVGGLIGQNVDTPITSGYAIGSVDGKQNVGGLIGQNVNAPITLGYAIGGVAGSANNVGGLVGWNVDAVITTSYARGDVSGEENVGGLVGRAEKNANGVGDENLPDSIENSYATGSVAGSANNVGGLVGNNQNGSIGNSHATGGVAGSANNVGGLVGWNVDAVITMSYARGDVSGEENVGGLVGNNQSGSIGNSYAIGDVAGSANNVGGLVGRNGDTITGSYAGGNVSGETNVGGLVGNNRDGSIADSYARGKVAGNLNIGGIVGQGVLGAIANSYWDITIAATLNNDGRGFSTDALQMPIAPGGTSTDVYYNWDTDVWDFGTATQYPVIKDNDGVLLPGQRIGLSDLIVLFAPAGPNNPTTLSLSPPFVPELFHYRVIGDSITRIRLMPTATNSAATITVSSDNGFSQRVRSGATSPEIGLKAGGATMITITVEANNDVSVRYTLAVNSSTFNEGEHIILDASNYFVVPGVELDYRWTQTSGLSLLPSAGISDAVLNIKLPEDLIPRNSTSANVGLRLEISFGDTPLYSGDTPITITKIDNGVIQSTVPITRRTSILTAPDIDLSADPDGSPTTTTYRWQMRLHRDADWIDIENAIAKTYSIPDNVSYSEYRLRFGYTDGQGYTRTLTSDALIFATDVDMTDIDKDDDGLIEISTLDELDAIRYQLDGSGYRLSKTTPKITTGCAVGGCKGYELTRSLDFEQSESYRDGIIKDTWTTGSGWQPLGNSSESFGSLFHGNGNTISNLRIDRAYTIQAIGLFGVLSDGAEIDGIGLVDADITGGDSVGGLVGHKNGGVISDSYVHGRISGTGDYDVGGLVGWHQGGTIVNSHSTATVVGAGTNSGGLVGFNDGGTITRSYAVGSVSGHENSGGLVGDNNAGAITLSYASVQVEGSGAVGGLIGKNSDIIANSYARGDVIGSGDVGGLVGWNFADIINSYAGGDVDGDNGVGGLVGNNHRSIIANSYAHGDITASAQYVGGLIGWNGAGIITDSYAHGDIVGRVGVGGLVGVNVGEFNNTATGVILRSYAVGSVSATADGGGLVGENRQGLVRYSYWNKTENPMQTSAGGTSKTSVVLRSTTEPGMNPSDVYYDWSTDDWDFTDTTRYPILKHAVGSDNENPACGDTDDLPACRIPLAGQFENTDGSPNPTSSDLRVQIRILLGGFLK